MALQGYTKIELTDVETNNTEVYEKHNIVTNALSEIFRPIGYWKDCNSLLNRTNPWVSTLCGGLLCFDKNIPEDKNTLFAPAGTTLIACGAHGEVNATSNSIRGDSNKLETSINTSTKVAKFVYDFKTSQGNGTINSVCLTSYRGGFRSYNMNLNADANSQHLQDYSHYCIGEVYPYISSEYDYDTCKNAERIFLIDSKSGVKYSLLYDTIDYLKIIKRNVYTHSISIFDSDINASKTRILSSTQIKLNIGRLCDVYRWWSYDDRALYLFLPKTSNDGSGSVASGKTIRIIKLSYPNWDAEYFDVENTTDGTISCNSCCVYKNNLYFATSYSSSNMYYIQPYRVNILDSSDYSKFAKTQRQSADDLRPISVFNGKILYFGLYRYSYSYTYDSFIFDTELGTGSVTDCATTWASGYLMNPILDDNFHFYSGYKHSVIVPSNYLATINNLETPITKTSDKTMKITYTLKEVDS